MISLLRFSILAATSIALFADIPRVSSESSFAAGDIPSLSVSSHSRQAASDTDAPAQPEPPADEAALSKDRDAAQITGDMSQPLKPEMKVEIIRYIDGEFGKAAKAIPGKTGGFTIHVGKPIDDQSYQDALRLQGTAIGPGDPIQVTRVDFEARKIVLQLNGGAKKKFHLMDHLQIGLGGADTPPAQSPDDQPRRAEGLGAVVVLDYGKPLPDVSPSEIKAELRPLIDFSKQPSAAVNWVETLPPAFQNAVRDHKALPGMDGKTVIAAIGRPDRKVREKNQDGVETEDWIYGNPPARTTFVTFIGDRVVRVEECGGPKSETDTSSTCARM